MISAITALSGPGAGLSKTGIANPISIPAIGNPLKAKNSSRLPFSDRAPFESSLATIIAAAKIRVGANGPRVL